MCQNAFEFSPNFNVVFVSQNFAHLVDPEILPLRQAVHHLVVLDRPEHEDDTADDTEDEGVGEVFVDRQLDQVPSQPELSSGGHDGREHPPRDISIPVRSETRGGLEILTSTLRRL